MNGLIAVWVVVAVVTISLRGWVIIREFQDENFWIDAHMKQVKARAKREERREEDNAIQLLADLEMASK